MYQSIRGQDGHLCLMICPKTHLVEDVENSLHTKLCQNLFSGYEEIDMYQSVRAAIFVDRSAQNASLVEDAEFLLHVKFR